MATCIHALKLFEMQIHLNYTGAGDLSDFKLENVWLKPKEQKRKSLT